MVAKAFLFKCQRTLDMPDWVRRRQPVVDLGDATLTVRSFESFAETVTVKYNEWLVIDMTTEAHAVPVALFDAIRAADINS